MKKTLLASIFLMAGHTSFAQTESAPVVPCYRNLFVEAGHTPQEVETRLQEVYDSLFFGPRRIYFEVEDSLGYVSDIKNEDVRTEGMSYGLMVSVQMNRKDVFDRLWRWAKKYMQMQEGFNKGYFRWSCRVDGSSNAHGPASDGELYFITTLLMASNLWGNDSGINYLAEAQHILDCIQPREAEMPAWGNRPARKVTLSLIDPATKLITFVPGMNFTDPSYHIPAFYEYWAQYAQDGRSEYWKECARASREYLHHATHPVTGLTPDYSNYDGSLMGSQQIIGDCFRYDSWRVPMNITLDYVWSGGADAEWQQQYATRIQDFFYKEGIDTFLDQYNVDGTAPERILSAGGYTVRRHSVGLVATLAAASIVSRHPARMEFVKRLWNSTHLPYADGYYDAYYDGLLRLFAFMHLSGKYHMITPVTK